MDFFCPRISKYILLIIEKLRTEKELQVAFESIQIPSNDNKNNEIFQEIEEYDNVFSFL
jgi:hypothetical protein